MNRRGVFIALPCLGAAFAAYAQAVRDGSFPDAAHSYA